MILCSHLYSSGSAKDSHLHYCQGYVCELISLRLDLFWYCRPALIYYAMYCYAMLCFMLLLRCVALRYFALYDIAHFIAVCCIVAARRKGGGGRGILCYHGHIQSSYLCYSGQLMLQRHFRMITLWYFCKEITNVNISHKIQFFWKSHEPPN